MTIYQFYLRDSTLAEVRRGVDDERQERYLDGPNDVDWIFPNSIIQQRENRLYVGYFCEDSEESDQEEGYWLSPLVDVARLSEYFSYYTSSVVNLARALHQTNATTSEGLSVVAEVWRNVDVHDQMHFDELETLNRRTLEALNVRGLPAPVSVEVQATIEKRWIYPLWTLDLRKLTVQREELLKVREEWHPDVY